MSSERQEQRIPQDAPFNIPVSWKAWVAAQIGVMLMTLLTMGVAYEVTQQTLYGPVSVAEATGLAFYVVVGTGFLGPYSPFKARGETDV
jgi:uncharacterized membrane protein (DUF441 family)